MFSERNLFLPPTTCPPPPIPFGPLRLGTITNETSSPAPDSDHLWQSAAPQHSGSRSELVDPTVESAMKMDLSAPLLVVAVLFQLEVTAMFVRQPRAFRVNSYERLPYKRSWSDMSQRFASAYSPLRLKIEDSEKDTAAQKIIELFLNKGLQAEDYASSYTDGQCVCLAEAWLETNGWTWLQHLLFVL